MMATLANVGPMFGGVRPVVQHWPTLPPPLATLGRTLANVRIANVDQCWTQCLATFLKKGSLEIIMAGHTFWELGLLGSYFFQCQFSHRFLMTFWRPPDPQKLQKWIQIRVKILPETYP